MDFCDHAYTITTYDKVNPVEFTYKMNSKETEEFVKLRISNKFLFSGKRNTSMWAWRSILLHMGLQHKMTHSQASKKWENMKKRYKELKNPPEGVRVVPTSWPHFTLMDDAMEGRLEGNAPVLKAIPSNKDSGDFLPVSKPKKKRLLSSSTASSAGRPEAEVTMNGDGEAGEGSLEAVRITQEAEDERSAADSERQAMEREKQVMERERLVLQRERAALDREAAALDRGRASLERERATIEREKAVMEREKAVMERERAMLEKDRDAVSRERLALEREKAGMGRVSASREKSEKAKDDVSKGVDSDAVDRKVRFLNLFEELLEKF